MIVSIHQPGYLPWLGFFKKIQSSDIFVFLDDVQFEKNGWHNRNKIKTSENWMWLTVPVNAKLGTNLNQIRIDYSSKWIKKHKKSIELNYSKSEFFDKYWSNFENIYEKKYELLVDLNMAFIKKIMEFLDIKTKILFSSSLEITEKKKDTSSFSLPSYHSYYNDLTTPEQLYYGEDENEDINRNLYDDEYW